MKIITLIMMLMLQITICAENQHTDNDHKVKVIAQLKGDSVVFTIDIPKGPPSRLHWKGSIETLHYAQIVGPNIDVPLARRIQGLGQKKQIKFTLPRSTLNGVSLNLTIHTPDQELRVLRTNTKIRKIDLEELTNKEEVKK